MATMLNPNAIPDGSITQEKIESSVLAGKQDKLTAGNGINIEGNKIDVTTITESESQPSTHLWVNPSEDAETGMTYNRSQIDALVGAKQDTLQLTVKDNGNIVLANIQGQSKEFMPATPSGDPMHYAYVSAGAEYNDTGADIIKTSPWADLADDDADKTVVHKAGYWYLNGLGDITNDEIRKIYQLTATFPEGPNLDERFRSMLFRTNFCNKRQIAGYISLHSTALNAGNKNCIVFSIFNSQVNHDLRYSFFGNKNLIHIIGEIVKPDNINNNLIFDNNTIISTIKVKSLISNLLIPSPNLSIKSVLYMIENEVATSTITITLHADAYARAMANADIVAALEAHPNVSLASA